MAKQREFWITQKEPIEYLTSQCVGFPVQLYWAAASDGDKYQVMLHSSYENATVGKPTPHLVKDFWKWHLRTNEQWFTTPLKAAEAFVKVWFQYITRPDISRKIFNQLTTTAREAILEQMRDMVAENSRKE